MEVEVKNFYNDNKSMIMNLRSRYYLIVYIMIINLRSSLQCDFTAWP